MGSNDVVDSFTSTRTPHSDATPSLYTLPTYLSLQPTLAPLSSHPPITPFLLPFPFTSFLHTLLSHPTTSTPYLYTVIQHHIFIISPFLNKITKREDYNTPGDYWEKVPCENELEKILNGMDYVAENSQEPENCYLTHSGRGGEVQSEPEFPVAE